MGPLAREVLAQVTENDLENENFPFGMCLNIGIKEELAPDVPEVFGFASNLCRRIGLGTAFAS